MGKDIREVVIFLNGNVGVLDLEGKQIPELQRPLHEVWAEYAVSKGFNPEGVAFNNRGLLTYTPEIGWQVVTRHEYHVIHKKKEPDK